MKRREGAETTATSFRSRVAVFVGLATSVLLSACRSTEARTRNAEPIDAQPHARVIQLRTDTVTRLGIRAAPAGDIDSAAALHIPGSLDYNVDRYADVGTLLEGRVASVLVKIGDRVSAGQALATLMVPSIANARAEYLAAAAAASAARQNTDREQKLLKGGLTTTREAEVARRDAAGAEARLSATSAKLRALHIDVPRDRDAVGGAGTHVLRTPIDGVIVRRDIVLGAYLQPSKTAFAVADLSELWAMLDVYEADLPYLREGASVHLTFDALAGKTVEGKVALLESRLGKASRSVRARVDVPNPDGELRPGLYCRASVDLPGTESDTVMLPAQAVQPLAEQDVVFVERSAGNFEVRPVRVVRRTSEIVEVAEGVGAADRVVIEGAFFLRGEVTRQ